MNNRKVKVANYFRNRELSQLSFAAEGQTWRILSVERANGHHIENQDELARSGGRIDTDLVTIWSEDTNATLETTWANVGC